MLKQNVGAADEGLPVGKRAGADTAVIIAQADTGEQSPAQSSLNHLHTGGNIVYTNTGLFTAQVILPHPLRHKTRQNRVRLMADIKKLGQRLILKFMVANHTDIFLREQELPFIPGVFSPQHRHIQTAVQ